MVGAWVSSYCLNIEGFLKILYVTLQKLKVKDHPEYEGCEYMKHGTGKSEEFPDITKT
jgi:hypothetical protein